MQETKKKSKQLITEKPTFEDMVEMHRLLKQALIMLNALADEGDTIQRATDLTGQIENIQDLANTMLYKE